MLSLALIGLTACERDPDAGVPEPYRNLEVPSEHLASAEARRDGRELYLAMCALCHGQNADGRGVRSQLGTDPRDFTDPRWQRAMSPRRVYWIIQEGRRGTAMASFSVLSESQTWDLVAYLLSVAEDGARVEGVDEGVDEDAGNAVEDADPSAPGA